MVIAVDPSPSSGAVYGRAAGLTLIQSAHFVGPGLYFEPRRFDT